MKSMRHPWRLFAGTLFLLGGGVAGAWAQQDPEMAVRLSDHFDEERGQLVFYAENRDFCDYYVTISFVYAEGFTGMAGSTSALVRPGEQMLRDYRVQEGAQRIGYNYQYALFRGDPRAKLDAEFTYALPVAVEETVTARLVENRDGYQVEFELPADTVYACRGGVVCDDQLKDFSAKGHGRFADTRNGAQVTLSHADGSFGEYVFFGQPLVYAGERVEMGQPIAVTRENVGRHAVRFAVYFLDMNKMKELRMGNKHTHIRPFFQTYNDGKARLEEGKTYISEWTDDMPLQDMTKRERKRYLRQSGKP